MKIPTRPAPCVPPTRATSQPSFQTNCVPPTRATSQPSFITNTYKQSVSQSGIRKKVPPPRPPPPKFKTSCHWGFNTNKQYSLGLSPDFTTSLIDLSLPTNDYINTKSGSDSIAVGNSSFFGNDFFTSSELQLSRTVSLMNLADPTPTPSPSAPTIIRAQPKIKKEYCFKITDVRRHEIDVNNYSPPMPTVPPPSPPACSSDSSICDDDTPYGIALFNYSATHEGDLSLQENDIVVLHHRVNEEWFYGKVGDAEGIFPANFVDIRIPLPESANQLAVALYEFQPETADDLKLVPGEKVKVLRRVSRDWLYGESLGMRGQFPANFIDHIPPNI